MQCRDCRWFTKRKEFHFGQCHKNPPTAGWPAVKPDDFCACYEAKQKTAAEFDEEAMRQLTVMAKQLRNGCPILPLPENLSALRVILSDEEASPNTAADPPQG